MTFNPTLATTKEEYARASAGIKNPQVITLHAGDAIFRFASTKDPLTGASVPSSKWARGAWWFQEQDYQHIIDNYQSQNLGLGTVGRVAGAVMPSWSNVDVSIKAYLLDDVNVYIGKGAPQFRDPLPNGMYVTMRGWPDIDQLYIPGMRGTTFSAIRIVRQKIITTNSFGF